MRRVAVVVIAGLLSLGSVEPGIAEPFGLSMGMKPEEVGGKLEKLEGLGTYRTKEVPKPHSAFGVYVLVFGPTTGMCVIIAGSNPVETSPSGTELRNTFDQIKELISSHYGKYERVDFLRERSIWNKPQEFMWSLLKNERTLATDWRAKVGSAMKDNLEEIKLEASALPSRNGLILVKYSFQNVNECQKELRAAVLLRAVH